jgi:hypothetical protein
MQPLLFGCQMTLEEVGNRLGQFAGIVGSRHGKSYTSIEPVTFDAKGFKKA